MKFLSLLLLLFLSLFAGNMSLGPYNDKSFQTIKEQENEASRLTLEKKAQQESRVKAFHKRQAELKIQRHEEKVKRIKLEEARIEKIRIEEKRIRDEEIRVQKETEFRIEEERRREEEKRKHEAYLAQEHQMKKEKEIENESYEVGDTNLTLIPEQANISNLNPDDIDTELANIDRLRYILLYSENTPQFIKDYILFLDEIEEKYHIDFAFSYRGIAQAELYTGTKSGGGKYDFTLRYRPAEETSFAVRFDGRHQAGSHSVSEFREEIDALVNTSASYRDEKFYLSQAWMQQGLGDFVFRAGKIDPSSYMDSHLFKSNSRFFFSSNFSASPYNAYPSNGIGVAGRFTKEQFYAAAEITDANAVKDSMQTEFFSKNKYYTALEFGLQPLDGSKYHITAWHRDAGDIKTEESEGMIASIVQAIDTDTHLIIRGAFSDHAKAKRYASIGIGKYSLFAQHDISGLAIGWLEPYDPDEDDDIYYRNQTTIESFYRIDPLPGVQLSADLQVIYHPSLGDKTWAVLPGLRLRILF